MESIKTSLLLKFFVGLNIALIQYPKLFLRRNKPKLKRLEKLLLELVAEGLKEKAKIALKSQIEEVNLVDWDTQEHTHVYFSKLRPFYYDLNRVQKLNIDDESNFITVLFEVEGLKYVAKFYSVYGNLFSIEFNKNVTKIANTKEINIIKLKGDKNVLLQ